MEQGQISTLLDKFPPRRPRYGSSLRRSRSFRRSKVLFYVPSPPPSIALISRERQCDCRYALTSQSLGDRQRGSHMTTNKLERAGSKRDDYRRNLANNCIYSSDLAIGCPSLLSASYKLANILMLLRVRIRSDLTR